ncbi:MAG: lipopolysaccharide biosynthesis protein [Bacteroidia bacterium]
MTVVRRQGVKNTVYTYAGIVLGVVSTLYVQPFFLTKEQIGITRLVISVATIFASFACLGITSVVVKFLPLFYDKEKKHGGFFTLAIVFPVVGFAVCLLCALLFKDSILSFYGKNAAILATYFIPIAMMALIMSLIYAFTAYCGAINKSSPATLINEVVSRVGFMSCILLFSYGITTQNVFVYTLSIVYFIQLVLLFGIISHFDHPTFRTSFFADNKHLKEIMVYGITFSFIQITGICTKFVDIILVGKYETMQQVGVFSIAAFIGLVIETPLLALEKIAGTKIAKLFAQNNHSEIEKIYKLSSKYLMLICGLMGSVLVVCIKPTLALLPNDYSAGAVVTIIICIGAFFNAATGTNYSILTYSKHYKLGAVFYAFLLVLTITLNMLLIPLYGIMGAAIATCAASITHNLLRFIFIKVKLNMQPFTFDSLKIVLIIAVSVLVAYNITIENKYLLILTRGTVASLIFIGLVVALKVFSIKEIKAEVDSLKKTFS